ncbi:MAG TPA: hypothetical protein VKQ72_14445 [Aggregatilineales bacterium]|nr:hypothetical protein [Aggregatilineales bacterium]
MFADEWVQIGIRIQQGLVESFNLVDITTGSTAGLALEDGSAQSFFERHLVRLLIVLYYCGQPANSLLAGETRQVDSIWRLQQFDFWVREPGHLALALLRSYASAPERFTDTFPTFQAGLDAMLKDDLADVRRVRLPSASHNYILEDLDYSFSFLTARDLISDRPSFANSRNYTHQIVLEVPGVTFVQKVLADCPMFDWYRQQCELVALYYPRLERYDLAFMSYLAPELTPVGAATTPLVPYIRRRMETVFAPGFFTGNDNGREDSSPAQGKSQE